MALSSASIVLVCAYLLLFYRVVNLKEITVAEWQIILFLSGLYLLGRKDGAMAPRSMAERQAAASLAKYHDVEKEILECPICLEQVIPPVYQCQSGHVVCSACYAKMRQCPACSQSVGTFIRNLLAEKIVESLQVKCPHAHHGCTQMVKVKDAEEHWRSLCAYRPCPCPAPGCMHEGPKQTLPLHLQNEHQVLTKTGLEFNCFLAANHTWQFELKPSDQSRFVILNDQNNKPRLLLRRENIAGLGEILFCTSFEDHSIKYNLKVMVAQDIYKPYTTIDGASAVDIRLRNDWKKDGFLCCNPQKLTGEGTKLHIFIPWDSILMAR